jgi:SPP1 family predicted phage head-tail adaptor
MQPGELNKRIEIQQDLGIPDDSGLHVPNWQPFVTVWAKVQDLTGREFFQAAQTQSESTTKFTIRFRSVENNMRILFDGGLYEIVYIDRGQHKGAYMTITAKRTEDGA